MSIKKDMNTAASDRRAEWPFGKKNYVSFAVALVVIVIGFVLLDRGSITAAPLLLVVGFCILVPVAIMLRDRKSDDSPEAPEPPPSG